MGTTLYLALNYDPTREIILGRVVVQILHYDN